MDNVPEVPKCFGMFPPKYATYLISLCGLGSGGVGLAGVVLYGLVEDSIVAHFMSNNKTDDTVKKAVLLTVGLSSLFIFISCFLLFIGVAFKMPGCLTSGAWTIFIMCCLVILGAVGAPMSCFFVPFTCVIKKLSSALLVMGYIGITFFLWIWMYFMVVVFNYLNEL